MSKKILSFVLIIILVMSSTLAFAENYDLHHKITGRKLTLMSVLFDFDLFFEVASSLNNYAVEFDEKFYNADEVQDKFNKNPSIEMKYAVADLIPIDLDVTDDLIVIDIY